MMSAGYEKQEPPPPVGFRVWARVILAVAFTIAAVVTACETLGGRPTGSEDVSLGQLHRVLSDGVAAVVFLLALVGLAVLSSRRD